MKKPVKITLICASVFLAVIVLAVGFFFLLIEPNIKIFGGAELDFDSLASASRTVTILDADGNPLDDALYDGNKIYVKLDDLPDYTANAFIAIEDKRFYKHGGVDYKRMLSALLSDIKSRSFREGGSTITQQLIKNTHLSNEKTLKRKLNEIRLARALERVYTKPQILESYLNILYFGSGIRGLGTASRVMFGIPASELSLAQSASLASIINNPTKYSPYDNIENLEKRKTLVLGQMLDQGYISQSEYDAALAEKIEFEKNKQSQYVSGILKSACKRLNCSEKQLFINNITIKTECDTQLTATVRKILSETSDEYTVRVLILDNATGGIVCDETNVPGYINPRRSPASTVKPFLSYATALENGMNPLSQILDEPTRFGDYSPSNYNDVYRGYISLKEGLIYSSNVAAVKLLDKFGTDNAVSTAEAFGLPFAQSDDHLGIALGGMQNGVTLSELANAYRTLANGGVYSPVDYLTDIDYGNGVHISVERNRLRAIQSDTAYLLTDMLSECAKTGTAKKLKHIKNIAAKTGTNGDKNGNYDCYCIAYTPKNTVAVWFGATPESPIDNSVTGSACCDIIKALYECGLMDVSEAFTMPESVSYYDVDASELRENHEVYLADPTLPKRYRLRALLSKRFLPIKKSIDIIDYYDKFLWDYE